MPRSSSPSQLPSITSPPHCSHLSTSSTLSHSKAVNPAAMSFMRASPAFRTLARSYATAAPKAAQVSPGKAAFPSWPSHWLECRDAMDAMDWREMGEAVEILVVWCSDVAFYAPLPSFVLLNPGFHSTANPDSSVKISPSLLN